MLRYWLQKSAGQPGPTRRDIDVLDMPRSVLPHVLLADVEPNTLRMKFRLVGTHAAHMYNFDFTGRYLDELRLPDGLMDIYHASYQFVAQSKTPLVGHAGYPKRREIGGFSLSEFALLPLMDGESVSQVLVVDHMGADGQSYSDELIGMSLTAHSLP